MVGVADTLDDDDDAEAVLGTSWLSLLDFGTRADFLWRHGVTELIPLSLRQPASSQYPPDSSPVDAGIIYDKISNMTSNHRKLDGSKCSVGLLEPPPVPINHKRARRPVVRIGLCPISTKRSDWHVGVS